MLGHRSSQFGRFTAAQPYRGRGGEDRCSGLLARHGRDRLRDEECAAWSGLAHGRGSVPPRWRGIALRRQARDHVPDAAAAARAVFDLRGKVARGVARAARPFATSARQLLRRQRLLHEPAGASFKRSLALGRAHRTGGVRR